MGHDSVPVAQMPLPLRARENFPITGIAISTYPDLVNALVSVKHAATAANRDLVRRQSATLESVGNTRTGCRDGCAGY